MAKAAIRVSVLFALSVAGMNAGCVTPAATQSQRDVRRLRALERSFYAFTATRLQALDDVEGATSALEQLRLDYVEALADPSSAERDRLLALLRLAELHLDLSARIRRMPYPPGLDESQQRQLDVQLSALALGCKQKSADAGSYGVSSQNAAALG
jgi:hypothetical protein